MQVRDPSRSEWRCRHHNLRIQGTDAAVQHWIDEHDGRRDNFYQALRSQVFERLRHGRTPTPPTTTPNTSPVPKPKKKTDAEEEADRLKESPNAVDDELKEANAKAAKEADERDRLKESPNAVDEELDYLNAKAAKEKEAKAQKPRQSQPGPSNKKASESKPTVPANPKPSTSKGNAKASEYLGLDKDKPKQGEHDAGGKKK